MQLLFKEKLLQKLAFNAHNIYIFVNYLHPHGSVLNYSSVNNIQHFLCFSLFFFSSTVSLLEAGIARSLQQLGHGLADLEVGGLFPREQEIFHNIQTSSGDISAGA
jgi:hypothetical protein